jgi:hypothetical protein
MIQKFQSKLFIKKKILIKKYISTPMFMATSFKTAKILKQLKCSSMDEWIKKSGIYL